MTNALKGVILGLVNIIFQGLDVFDVDWLNEDQRAWVVGVVNFLFASAIVFTAKMSPARSADYNKTL